MRISGSAHAQMNGKGNLRYTQWNIIHHEQEWKLAICSRMVGPGGQQGQKGQKYMLSLIHVNLKKQKRPESVIAVMAVLGCQLDYVWNELQSRDEEHTSERFESESFLH